MERDPSQRLGCHPEAEEYIKFHIYFMKSFEPNEWDLIEGKEVRPSFIPQLQGERDTSYFDAEFTSEDLVEEEVTTIDFTKQYTDAFKGFSFTNLNFED